MTSNVALSSAFYAKAEKILASQAQAPTTQVEARSRVDELVGAQISRQRLARNLSADALAEAIGVARPQIEEFESGAVRVGSRRLVALAQVLEVSPSFFFEGSLEGLLGDGVRLGRAGSGSYLRVIKTRNSVKTNEKASAPNPAEEAARIRSSISKLLSTNSFYEENLKRRLESVYSGARLFSLYVAPDSIVIEPSHRFLASGEALLSAPTTNRRGLQVDASLSAPVRVSGRWSQDAVIVDSTELAPIEAHQPPDLALRLSAASRLRSRRAARSRSGARKNRSRVRSAS